MSVEITKPPAELEGRLRFETLIANLSSKFVNLPAGQVDREIMEAEGYICNALNLDISAIWQRSAGPPGGFTLTHYYSAQDGPQPAMPLSDIDFPWFRQLMIEGRIVPISSLVEMPAEASIDRDNCRRLGVKSNLCLPLRVGGEPPNGILGLNTTRAERDWPDALVKRLPLVTRVFTNALARKRADQALRESEERMTLAAEAAELGLWVWNIAGDEVWGSPRWRRMFGFTSAEHVGFAQVIERIHPDDRGTVEREVRRAVAERTDYAGEFRALLPDGTQRWVLSRGRGQGDASGTPARMLGAAMDITERKRTEEALRASEARLAAGTELAGLGYYEIDYAERTSFVDNRFREICGIPAELAQSLQAAGFWLKRVHADDLQLISQERQKLHDGKLDQIALEYRYLHPTKGERWLHHSARFAGGGAGGTGIRTFGVLRDVTQPKRIAEQQAEDVRFVTLLADLSSRFVNLPASEVDREILNALRSICEALDLDLTAVWQWSESGPGRFMATHYYSALQGPQSPGDLKEEDYPWLGQQLLAGRLNDFASLDDFPAEAAQDRENCRRLGIKSHLSLPLATGDGPTFGILGLNTARQERAWPAPIVKRLQLVAQILANSIARKRADEERQRLRLQLWHADRVAQTGAITGSLAHELNQPLTGILSTAQAGLRFLARGNPDPGEMHGILTNIVHDTKRAGAIINGLRAMLRQKAAVRGPLALAETIHGVLALLHSELVVRRVEPHLRVESDFRVLADKAQIQQVLLNLLLNALEAMQDQPPEQRRLELSLTRSDQGQALISVRDSGPGITPDRQELIFKAFWTTKSQGMGIGLPIAHAIIESHGGRLWCENHPDAGAVFHVAMPIERDEGRGNK